ncbi:MAG: tautomerase family protein [Chitinispirillaceae bacterium]|nr:tautomerase family protein [Chitinispirillaceae bacterium]
MPLITISLFRGKTAEHKKRINDAIHESLMIHFNIKNWDYNQKTNEYSREDWTIPDGRSDNYVLIEICVFPGRSKETKKNLYAEIVNRLEDTGIKKEDVFIALQEQPMENWGIRGGISADEVDLGYNRFV